MGSQSTHPNKTVLVPFVGQTERQTYIIVPVENVGSENNMSGDYTEHEEVVVRDGTEDGDEFEIVTRVSYHALKGVAFSVDSRSNR